MEKSSKLPVQYFVCLLFVRAAHVDLLVDAVVMVVEIKENAQFPAPSPPVQRLYRLTQTAPAVGNCMWEAGSRETLIDRRARVRARGVWVLCRRRESRFAVVPHRLFCLVPYAAQGWEDANAQDSRSLRRCLRRLIRLVVREGIAMAAESDRGKKQEVRLAGRCEMHGRRGKCGWCRRCGSHLSPSLAPSARCPSASQPRGWCGGARRDAAAERLRRFTLAPRAVGGAGRRSSWHRERWVRSTRSRGRGRRCTQARPAHSRSSPQACAERQTSCAIEQLGGHAIVAA